MRWGLSSRPKRLRRKKHGGSNNSSNGSNNSNGGSNNSSNNGNNKAGSRQQGKDAGEGEGERERERKASCPAGPIDYLHRASPVPSIICSISSPSPLPKPGS